MDPSTLPADLIRDICKGLNDRDLINFTESHSRIHQVCIDELEKRKEKHFYGIYREKAEREAMIKSYMDHIIGSHAVGSSYEFMKYFPNGVSSAVFVYENLGGFVIANHIVYDATKKDVDQIKALGPIPSVPASPMLQWRMGLIGYKPYWSSTGGSDNSFSLYYEINDLYDLHEFFENLIDEGYILTATDPLF